MKHPSLNRNSAILINILSILILITSIILSSNSLRRNIQINNNENVNNISNEIIGNIDQSRIINADSEPHNWLAHGRDYKEQRYSPLDQINTETIIKNTTHSNYWISKHLLICHSITKVKNLKGK